MTNVSSILQNAEIPVLLLFVAGECESVKSPEIIKLEEILTTHPKSVSYYIICVREGDMPFPRIQTPALYYFLPKTTTPSFWRGGGFENTAEKDVYIIHHMLAGLTYDEANFSDEEMQKISEIDRLFENEKPATEQLPSFLRQARSLAKEFWETGKRAGSGLPVIVDLETGVHRLSTCQACDFFSSDSRCLKCGCHMKMKTQFASASCPLGKWNSV